MNNLFISMKEKNVGKETCRNISKMVAKTFEKNNLNMGWGGETSNICQAKSMYINEEVQNIINLVFTIITIITMIICFFSLVSTMGGNIIKQAREIGVMRCIGMKKYQITMLYVYEAFVLVFSSSLFGILIGLLIGYTMTAQRALFTNIPIPYEFPWSNFFTVLVVSIICAFASSYGPAKTIVNQEISMIMRN